MLVIAMSKQRGNAASGIQVVKIPCADELINSISEYGTPTRRNGNTYHVNVHAKPLDTPGLGEYIQSWCQNSNWTSVAAAPAAMTVVENIKDIDQSLTPVNTQNCRVDINNMPYIINSDTGEAEFVAQDYICNTLP
jgi:hypothetical protein